MVRVTKGKVTTRTTTPPPSSPLQAARAKAASDPNIQATEGSGMLVLTYLRPYTKKFKGGGSFTKKRAIRYEKYSLASGSLSEYTDINRTASGGFQSKRRVNLAKGFVERRNPAAVAKAAGMTTKEFQELPRKSRDALRSYHAQGRLRTAGTPDPRPPKKEPVTRESRIRAAQAGYTFGGSPQELKTRFFTEQQRTAQGFRGKDFVSSGVTRPSKTRDYVGSPLTTTILEGLTTRKGLGFDETKPLAAKTIARDTFIQQPGLIKSGYKSESSIISIPTPAQAALITGGKQGKPGTIPIEVSSTIPGKAFTKLESLNKEAANTMKSFGLSKPLKLAEKGLKLEATKFYDYSKTDRKTAFGTPDVKKYAALGLSYAAGSFGETIKLVRTKPITGIAQVGAGFAVGGGLGLLGKGAKSGKLAIRVLSKGTRAGTIGLGALGLGAYSGVKGYEFYKGDFQARTRVLGSVAFDVATFGGGAYAGTRLFSPRIATITKAGKPRGKATPLTRGTKPTVRPTADYTLNPAATKAGKGQTLLTKSARRGSKLNPIYSQQKPKYNIFRVETARLVRGKHYTSTHEVVTTSKGKRLYELIKVDKKGGLRTGLRKPTITTINRYAPRPTSLKTFRPTTGTSTGIGTSVGLGIGTGASTGALLGAKALLTPKIKGKVEIGSITDPKARTRPRVIPTIGIKSLTNTKTGSLTSTLSAIGLASLSIPAVTTIAATGLLTSPPTTGQRPPPGIGFPKLPQQGSVSTSSPFNWPKTARIKSFPKPSLAVLVGGVKPTVSIKSPFFTGIGFRG